MRKKGVRKGSKETMNKYTFCACTLPCEKEKKVFLKRTEKGSSSIVRSMKGNCGMEYVLVMKWSDTGYIHVESLRSRGAKDIATAFEKGESFFRSFGQCHELQNSTTKHQEP